MIASHAERALVELARSDEVLSRLRTALDRDRVRESLVLARAHVLFDATSIEGCNVDRVYFGSKLGYVVDTTLLVRGWVGLERVKAFVQVPFGDPVAAIGKAQDRLSARLDGDSGREHPRLLLLPDIGAILRPAGADERIDWLPALTSTNPLVRQRMLAALTGDATQWREARLLSHRLGKRAVLKLAGDDAADGAGKSAILKLYKRRSGAAAHCAAISAAAGRQGLESGSSVAIPRIIRLLDVQPGLLMEEAPGLPLHLTSGPLRLSGHRSAGEALARFHTCRIALLEPYGVDDEVHLLRQWLAFAASISPDLVGLLTPKVDRLAREASRCVPFTPVPIHRDFHDKQILVSHERATLIDFDTVRSGDPAQDVGNFLAHIHLGVRDGTAEPEQTADWQSFIDGYRTAAALPSAANIDWHRRASLLRLALIYGFSDTSARLAFTLANRA